jgi:hypothetical protein
MKLDSQQEFHIYLLHEKKFGTDFAVNNFLPLTYTLSHFHPLFDLRLKFYLKNVGAYVTDCKKNIHDIDKTNA